MKLKYLTFFAQNTSFAFCLGIMSTLDILTFTLSDIILCVSKSEEVPFTGKQITLEALEKPSLMVCAVHVKRNYSYRKAIIILILNSSNWRKSKGLSEPVVHFILSIELYCK